ncbi:MAG: hypothetical protein ACO2ON_03460 [Candidatus Nanopusillus sp.]
MVLNKIKAEFKKHINPYYKPISNRWNLSDDEKLQIAEYIKHNKEKIEPYFSTINKNNIDKVLNSIDRFARFRGFSVNLHIVSQYFNMLEDLDDKIEKIRKEFFNSLPKHNNVVNPNSNYYIEIAFDVAGNPEKRKETLIDILKKPIGNVGARGLPISYYNGTNNPSIQYYMEFYPDRTHIRIFIHKSIPPHIVGYLLYKLNNVKGKKSIIRPSGNMNYYIIKNEAGIINNRIGIDTDPNKDIYVSRALLYYRFLYEFF